MAPRNGLRSKWTGFDLGRVSRQSKLARRRTRHQKPDEAYIGEENLYNKVSCQFRIGVVPKRHTAHLGNSSHVRQQTCL